MLQQLAIINAGSAAEFIRTQGTILNGPSFKAPTVMPPATKARAALAGALLLLAFSGIAAFSTITRLLETQRWVIHTHEVQNALSNIDSALLKAGRSRKGYEMTQDENYLHQFESSPSEVLSAVDRVRDMTQDNSRQQELCSRLQGVVEKRVALLQRSIALTQQSPHDDAGQTEIDRLSLPVISELESIMEQMHDEEDRLLATRQQTAHRMLVLMVTTLACLFLLAVGLIVLHHKLLSDQLQAREMAERAARENEDSLRRLTVRMLQLQDAERRKFSRELHDGLGQGLVGAKMNLEMFAAQHKESLLAEAIRLLDQSIAETRTISHLLHPPLLDEAGLSSAARWYLEEFSRRSGIEIDTSKLEDAGDLPKPVALGLFRILQESLINMHRHSEATRAQVVIQSSPGRVHLEVRDFGKGISPELLGRYQSEGTNTGVGLGGMHERARELGGQLVVNSCDPGTLVSTTIPVSWSSVESAKPAACDDHAANNQAGK